MQQLTQEALDAKENVKTLVGDRKVRRGDGAPRPRGWTARPCAKAKQQEARIQKLIQEPSARPGSGPRTCSPRGRAAAARPTTVAPVDTDGLLMRPVNGPLTSPYGYRVHPIYHYWGLHDGDDFGAPCGAPLVAVRDGKVLTEYYSSVWGNRLYLNVGPGQRQVHHRDLQPPVAATPSAPVRVVSRGQVVGYVGTTGWSTGCHLHFTVMENGKPVDPMNTSDAGCSRPSVLTRQGAPRELRRRLEQSAWAA